MLLLLDEFKRTEKVLLAIAYNIPIIKKSIFSSNKRISSVPPKDHLWLNDEKEFTKRNNFTSKSVWKFAQIRWTNASFSVNIAIHNSL